MVRIISYQAQPAERHVELHGVPHLQKVEERPEKGQDERRDHHEEEPMIVSNSISGRSGNSIINFVGFNFSRFFAFTHLSPLAGDAHAMQMIPRI